MDHQIQQLFAEVFGDREVVVYRPGLARKLGPLPTLFLCQACYWQSIAGIGQWWHKLRDGDRDESGRLVPPKTRTRQSWEWELGIGRSEQQVCRRILREHGLLEEKLVGIPARLHFRVNVERLAEFLMSSDISTEKSSQLDSEGEPAGGDSVVVRQVSGQPTKSKINNESNRLLPSQVNLDGIVIEPEIQPYLQGIVEVLADVAISDRTMIQDLLDELAGAMRTAARQPESRQEIFDPAGWLRAVIAAGFRRARCVQLQLERQRLAENKSRLVVVRKEPDIDPGIQAKGERFYESVKPRGKQATGGQK